MMEWVVNHTIKKDKREEWICCGCGRYFPRSVLVVLHSKFEEVAGRYCDSCVRKAWKRRDEIMQEIAGLTSMRHCEACGDEYPLGYLNQDLLCERCEELEKD